MAQRKADRFASGHQIDHGRAKPAVKYAEQRLDRRGSVWHHDGHAFARRHAARGQIGGNGTRGPLQIGPVQRSAASKDEPGAPGFGALAQPVAQGALRR